MSGAALSSAKASEKPTFTGRAVRLFAFAFEAHDVGGGNAALRESRDVGVGVLRFQNEQRQAFMPLGEVARIGGKQGREAVAAKLVRLGQRQKFDEEARQLNDVIMRAPGMTVARADGKAELAIKFGGGVEIAHRMHHVVETARHSCHFALAFLAANAAAASWQICAKIKMATGARRSRALPVAESNSETTASRRCGYRGICYQDFFFLAGVAAVGAHGAI